MACTNDLPYDEHMMLETCRRHQELNQNVNLKSMYCVALRYVKVKVKIKCAVVQALRLCTGRTAHRGSRGIAVLYRH